MYSKDRIYWNIVKGIGIILVVLGHACTTVSNYIYLFHLPLFFFVTGFLYNEEKYGDAPFLYVSNKIKSLWMKYVIIYWVLIFLHNIFYELRMLGKNAVSYSWLDIVNKLSEAVFGMGQEIMGGTLWFVPVLVISSTILGFIITFSRKIYAFIDKIYIKYMVQAVLIAIATYVGYILCSNTIYLAGNIQIALIVMPFLWIGYIISVIKVNFMRFLNPVVALISVIILYIVSFRYRLDLALEFVYPYMHPVACLGIYACLYLAKWAQNKKVLSYIVETLGKMSFWIMFLHFPILRGIDWVYTIVWNQGNFEAYEIMPISYPQLCPIYLLFTIGIPLMMYTIYDLVMKKR